MLIRLGRKSEDTNLGWYQAGTINFTSPSHFPDPEDLLHNQVSLMHT